MTEPGTYVHIEGEELILARGATVVRKVRLQEVSEALLYGGVGISSAAIGALARRGVDVVFLTQEGYFRARLSGRASKNVVLRLAQFRRAGEAACCLALARAVVVGKATHQRALLLTVVETEVLRAGLDPMVGFFHQPLFGRPSLALDLMEELWPFVDGLVVRLVNRRQLGKGDFVRRGTATLAEILAEAEEPSEGSIGEGGGENGQRAEVGVFLSDSGRKVLISEFFRRMRER